MILLSLSSIQSLLGMYAIEARAPMPAREHASQSGEEGKRREAKKRVYVARNLYHKYLSERLGENFFRVMISAFAYNLINVI